MRTLNDMPKEPLVETPTRWTPFRGLVLAARTTGLIAIPISALWAVVAQMNPQLMLFENYSEAIGVDVGTRGYGAFPLIVIWLITVGFVELTERRCGFVSVWCYIIAGAASVAVVALPHFYYAAVGLHMLNGLISGSYWLQAGVVCSSNITAWSGIAFGLATKYVLEKCGMSVFDFLALDRYTSMDRW